MDTQKLSINNRYNATAFIKKGELMKKILVIGAGLLQAFIIRRAKEIGYYTIAIDKNPESIGFSYADEYAVIDIIDNDACLEFAKNMNIDGVMTAATDYGVLSAAYIAQEMELPGLKYKVAQIIKNKYEVRRILFDKNIDDVSQFIEINNINDIEKISSSIKFPVMVKPCDGSGSKGAKKVEVIDDLKSACESAIENSIIKKALIEDFICGKEYGVESFVYDGQVHVLGIMGKLMTNPPDYAELGHYFPSGVFIEDRVRDVVKKAIKAIGINFGSVNMDIIITEDNNICIIDIGARMGGNLIGSHIIPLGTGIEYIENLIRATAGDSIDLKPTKKGLIIVTKILALNPGYVLDLPDFEEIALLESVEIHHNLTLGKTIKRYQNNLDGCGYVVATDNNYKDAERRSKNARELINNGIVRQSNIPKTRLFSEVHIYSDKGGGKS